MKQRFFTLFMFSILTTAITISAANPAQKVPVARTSSFIEKAATALKKTGHYITSKEGLVDAGWAVGLLVVINTAHVMGHAIPTALYNVGLGKAFIDPKQIIKVVPSLCYGFSAPLAASNVQRIISLSGPLAGILTSVVSFIAAHKKNNRVISRLAIIIAALQQSKALIDVIL